jgi:hypothetical protein
VAQRYRVSCYVRATTWILQVDNNDFARTAEICRSAGTEWSLFCFRGFGRDAVVDAHYRDYQRVRALCTLALTYEGDCYYGAARTYGDGGGAAGVVEAARFCAQSPTTARERCAAGFGIVVGLLQPTARARRDLCARLAPKQADACAQAAEGEVDPTGAHAWG